MIKNLFQFWLGMLFHTDKDNEDNGEPRPTSEQRWINRTRVIVGSAVVLIFAGVIAYRLLTAHVSLEGFDFSQLISLVLALFSIALSAQFYFKATDTSNKFYDRTYRMTKDLFEVLGRIEERFGQMLQHIHEDTSATREYMGSKNERKTPIPTTEKETAKPNEK